MYIYSLDNCPQGSLIGVLRNNYWYSKQIHISKFYFYFQYLYKTNALLNLMLMKKNLQSLQTIGNLLKKRCLSSQLQRRWAPAPRLRLCAGAGRPRGSRRARRRLPTPCALPALTPPEGEDIVQQPKNAMLGSQTT